MKTGSMLVFSYWNIPENTHQTAIMKWSGCGQTHSLPILDLHCELWIGENANAWEYPHHLSFLPISFSPMWGWNLLCVAAISWMETWRCCFVLSALTPSVLPVATCFVVCSYPLPRLAKGGFILCSECLLCMLRNVTHSSEACTRIII